MKLVHNICGLLILAFLLFFSVSAVMLAMFQDTAFAMMLSEMLNQDLFVFRLGVAVLTVTLVYLCSFRGAGKKKVYLKFATEAGTVQVNLAAAANYLSKLKKEFAAVVSLHPVLKLKGRGVDVTLKTGIKSGTRIPELSSMLQRRARECLSEDLGLQDLSDIKIVIQEISGPPPVHEHDTNPVIDLGDQDTAENREDSEETDSDAEKEQ